MFRRQAVVAVSSSHPVAQHAVGRRRGDSLGVGGTPLSYAVFILCERAPLCVSPGAGVVSSFSLDGAVVVYSWS